MKNQCSRVTRRRVFAFCCAINKWTHNNSNEQINTVIVILISDIIVILIEVALLDYSQKVVAQSQVYGNVPTNSGLA